MSLNAHNAQGSVCDWVYSRTLERFPTLKLAYAESQVGWMPFQYERMDGVWHEMSQEQDLPRPPSTYARGRVFGCIFDDLHGLRCRDEIGMEHILFECDFPHTNGSFPNSRRRAWELSSKAGLDAQEVYQLVRGNAIDVYGLQRFGIDAMKGNPPRPHEHQPGPGRPRGSRRTTGGWSSPTLPSCRIPTRASPGRSRSTGWRMAPPW